MEIYPLVISKIAVENGPLIEDSPIMLSFYSYVDITIGFFFDAFLQNFPSTNPRIPS